MLADTLRQINEAEGKADNLMAKANETAQQIEKDAYREIEKINTATDAEIAKAVAQLPKLPPVSAPTVTLNVPDKKLNAAVDYITKALTELM